MRLYLERPIILLGHGRPKLISMTTFRGEAYSKFHGTPLNVLGN